MGWSTELFCNISFNKEAFNSKAEVEDRIDELDKQIKTYKDELRDLALMTEPSKFFNSEENLYYYVTQAVKENIQLLQEDVIERWKLSVLLDEWDNCHNEEGLAIYPPDNIKWNTSFLCGDFVRSTKYPDDKSLLE